MSEAAARYEAWPCPQPGGGTGEEAALVFAAPPGAPRLLLLPPLFDEANKTRRQLVEVLRRLALAGIGGVLPDLAGCNESLADPAAQTLAQWRIAAAEAARHLGATHVLGVRAGCWLAPPGLPGWLYAPARPGSVLRAMVRARTIASREAGRLETADSILLQAREVGTVLGGWTLGAALVRELEEAAFVPSPAQRVVDQAEIGGPALWLRAEPDEDPEQADMLAGLIAGALASSGAAEGGA